MTILAEHVIERLIQIEAGVHYSELPPPGHQTFVIVNRKSPVILSAPHGAITCRNNDKEKWHEEDEYTAGMALLLSDICQTSVIATIWRTEDSDPNEHSEEQSAYKRGLHHLVEISRARWLIDIHGTREDRQNTGLVDLGTNNYQTIEREHVAKFKGIVEQYLGKNVVTEGIQATQEFRMVRYCKDSLKMNAIQVEMKPSVRVANRRVDSSAYRNLGPSSASEHQVLGMMQAIVDFIEYLKGVE